MGKAGRFACIITPIALTIASIVCLIFVGLGGTNKSMSTANRLWFMKADTRNFNASPDRSVFENTDLDDRLIGQLFKDANTTKDLKDFYTVSLWNYCEGSVVEGSSRVDDCGKPKAQYYFDPLDVWGLNGTGTQDTVPKTLRDALNVYRTVTKWMFIAYVVAFVANVVELVIGFLAIFSRWGSFFTTIVAVVAALFTLIAAAMVTGIYATLTANFNTVLRPYGIEAVMGRNMYSFVWLGVMFSCGAALFWLFSVCCCSGRSNDAKRARGGEKGPYDYAPVSRSWGFGRKNRAAGANMPMQNMGTTNNAYEPYRHNAV